MEHTDLGSYLGQQMIFGPFLNGVFGRWVLKKNWLLFAVPYRFTWLSSSVIRFPFLSLIDATALMGMACLLSIYLEISFAYQALVLGFLDLRFVTNVHCSIVESCAYSRSLYEAVGSMGALNRGVVEDCYPMGQCASTHTVILRYRLLTLCWERFSLVWL